jgi:hypothetical protein
MAWRSVLTGAFGLAALDTVLSLGSSGQGQLSTVLQLPGRWARDFMSPAVPLVPDLRSAGGAQQSSNTGQSVFQPAAAMLPPAPDTPIVRNAGNGTT